jgi:hypothetical protein
MLTLQTIVLPPTLSELLHWLTELTTSDALMTSPVQAFSVQILVNVTLELLPVGVMLLMMFTLHVTLSGAPAGPGPRLLH